MSISITRRIHGFGLIDQLNNLDINSDDYENKFDKISKRLETVFPDEKQLQELETLYEKQLEKLRAKQEYERKYQADALAQIAEVAPLIENGSFEKINEMMKK